MENIDHLEAIASIVASIATATAATLAGIIYFIRRAQLKYQSSANYLQDTYLSNEQTKLRLRFKEVMEKSEEKKAVNGTIFEENDELFQEYCNQWELLASRIRHNELDEIYIMRALHPTLELVWECLKPYIMAEREKIPCVYPDLEWLAKRWKVVNPLWLSKWTVVNRAKIKLKILLAN